MRGELGQQAVLPPAGSFGKALVQFGLGFTCIFGMLWRFLLATHTLGMDCWVQLGPNTCLLLILSLHDMCMIFSPTVCHVRVCALVSVCISIAHRRRVEAWAMEPECK